MSKVIKLTTEEQAAIKSLHRLSKKWPVSLSLFSHSGTLCICRCENGLQYVVDNINGIPNDGGDPDQDEVVQDVEVEWPAKRQDGE